MGGQLARLGVTYAPMRRSLLVLLLGALAIYPLQAAVNVDAAFKAFWDAPNSSAAEKASHAVVGSGVSFEEGWTRLKAGRTYAKEKTGLIRHPTSVGGVAIGNIIEVPEEYDAAKKWNEERIQGWCAKDRGPSSRGSG